MTMKGSFIKATVFLSLISCGWFASAVIAVPHQDFLNALQSARTNSPGDIVWVNGVEIIAERSYTPSHPGLSDWRSEFGDNVRFLRSSEMSDAVFNRYVTNWTALIDEIVLRVPEIRNAMIDVSHGKERYNIRFEKFTVGDRTVLGLFPDVSLDRNLVTGAQVYGKTTRAKLKKEYSSENRLWGYRREIGTQPGPGYRAPSRITQSVAQIERFVEARDAIAATGFTIDELLLQTPDKIRAVLPDASKHFKNFSGVSQHSFMNLGMP